MKVFIMKGKRFALLFSSFVFLFSSLVSAQDMFSGLGGGILQPIIDFISEPLRIPNLAFDAPYVPFWVLILGFMIAFSVIHLASAKIPLFKNGPKGPHKMFSIAVSFMVIFSTPFLASLLILVSTFTSIGMIAVFVLGIYTIWALLRGGWSEQSKAISDANKMEADANKNNLAARKLNHDIDAGNKALDKQKRALGRLTGKSGLGSLFGSKINRKGVIGIDIDDNNKLIEQLDKVSNILGESAHIEDENAKKLAKNSLKELGNILSKLTSRTQVTLRRLNRFINDLENGKKELDKLNLQKDIEDHISDFETQVNNMANNQPLTKQDTVKFENLKKILDDLKSLKNKYDGKYKDYVDFKGLQNLSNEIINMEGEKSKKASEIVNALKTNSLPPNSGGLIHELREILSHLVSLEGQFGEEVSNKESALDSLKYFDNLLKSIVNQESKLAKIHSGHARS